MERSGLQQPRRRHVLPGSLPSSKRPSLLIPSSTPPSPLMTSPPRSPVLDRSRSSSPQLHQQQQQQRRAAIQGGGRPASPTMAANKRQSFVARRPVPPMPLELLAFPTSPTFAPLSEWSVPAPAPAPVASSDEQPSSPTPAHALPLGQHGEPLAWRRSRSMSPNTSPPDSTAEQHVLAPALPIYSPRAPPLASTAHQGSSMDDKRWQKQEKHVATRATSPRAAAAATDGTDDKLWPCTAARPMSISLERSFSDGNFTASPRSSSSSSGPATKRGWHARATSSVRRAPSTPAPLAPSSSWSRTSSSSLSRRSVGGRGRIGNDGRSSASASGGSTDSTQSSKAGEPPLGSAFSPCSPASTAGTSPATMTRPGHSRWRHHNATPTYDDDGEGDDEGRQETRDASEQKDTRGRETSNASSSSKVSLSSSLGSTPEVQLARCVKIAEPLSMASDSQRHHALKLLKLGSGAVDDDAQRESLDVAVMDERDERTFVPSQQEQQRQQQLPPATPTLGRRTSHPIMERSTLYTRRPSAGINRPGSSSFSSISRSSNSSFAARVVEQDGGDGGGGAEMGEIARSLERMQAHVDDVCTATPPTSAARRAFAHHDDEPARRHSASVYNSPPPHPLLVLGDSQELIPHSPGELVFCGEDALNEDGSLAGLGISNGQGERWPATRAEGPSSSPPLTPSALAWRSVSPFEARPGSSASQYASYRPRSGTTTAASAYQSSAAGISPRKAQRFIDSQRALVADVVESARARKATAAAGMRPHLRKALPSIPGMRSAENVAADDARRRSILAAIEDMTPRTEHSFGCVAVPKSKPQPRPSFGVKLRRFIGSSSESVPSSSPSPLSRKPSHRRPGSMVDPSTAATAPVPPVRRRTLKRNSSWSRSSNKGTNKPSDSSPLLFPATPEMSDSPATMHATPETVKENDDSDEDVLHVQVANRFEAARIHELEAELTALAASPPTTPAAGERALSMHSRVPSSVTSEKDMRAFVDTPSSRPESSARLTPSTFEQKSRDHIVSIVDLYANDGQKSAATDDDRVSYFSLGHHGESEKLLTAINSLRADCRQMLQTAGMDSSSSMHTRTASGATASSIDSLPRVAPLQTGRNARESMFEYIDAFPSPPPTSLFGSARARELRLAREVC